MTCRERFSALQRQVTHKSCSLVVKTSWRFIQKQNISDYHIATDDHSLIINDNASLRHALKSDNQQRLEIVFYRKDDQPKNTSMTVVQNSGKFKTEQAPFKATKCVFWQMTCIHVDIHLLNQWAAVDPKCSLHQTRQYRSSNRQFLDGLLLYCRRQITAAQIASSWVMLDASVATLQMIWTVIEKTRLYHWRMWMMNKNNNLTERSKESCQQTILVNCLIHLLLLYLPYEIASTWIIITAWAMVYIHWK